MSRRTRAEKPVPPQPEPQGRHLGGWRRQVLAAALLVALTFAAHAPALRAGFLWDDDVYVTANPHLQDLAGLKAIWFEIGATKMYVPLVFTTFWLEHHLWGTEPLGYHVVNIALHAVGAILLWLLLARLALPGAWLAAAVFAVHPVFVESVAWVTELKNTQSTLFALVALLAWFRFSPPARRDGDPPGRRSFYLLALLAFAAALLSKPVVVALPLVLLLLVWWRRGRVARSELMAVAPMLAASLLAGLAAMHVERLYGGARGETWQLPLLDRLLVAGRATWFYVGKLLWPVGLLPIYPRWQIDPGASLPYLYPLAAASVLAGLWLGRRRFGRGPFVAAASFALLVAPLSGLWNVSYHLNSYVADHFQHHAAPALLALFAAGGTALGRRLPALHRVTPWVAGGLIATLVLASNRYAPVFANEEARCRATLAGNPDAWVAMNNLGVALNGQRHFTEAVPWFEKAIRTRPPYPEAESNLGVALVGLGELQAAIGHYRESLRVWAENPLAHNNLGTALAQVGQVDEARKEYATALALRPDYPQARTNLEQLEAARKAQTDPQAEVRAFAEAVHLRPEDAEARNNLGAALAAQGDLAGAIVQFTASARLQPQAVDTRLNLATALLSSDRPAEALAPLEEAARLGPGNARTELLWGVCLAQLGRLEEARRHFAEAVRLDPADGEARANLERAESALAGR